MCSGITRAYSDVPVVEVPRTSGKPLALVASGEAGVQSAAPKGNVSMLAEETVPWPSGNSSNVVDIVGAATADATVRELTVSPGVEALEQVVHATTHAVTNTDSRNLLVLAIEPITPRRVLEFHTARARSSLPAPRVPSPLALSADAANDDRACRRGASDGHANDRFQAISSAWATPN